jgi:hypothetical protein
MWQVSTNVAEEPVATVKAEAAGYCEMLPPFHERAQSDIPADFNRHSPLLRISRLRKILIS